MQDWQVEMSADIQPNRDVQPACREAFDREGYVVLPGLIEPALVAYFWSYMHTKFASMRMDCGDSQVPNSPLSYGDDACDGLLEYIRPRIEVASGRKLHPTYSYFRLYKHGDVLERHFDRDACEISLTLNIGQVPSDPWPLHVEGSGGAIAALLLPGDGLLYRGCDCPHWRERFEGNRLAQVFLHYVDAHGPHADHRFDKRPTLMRQKRNRTTKQDQRIP